MTGQLCFLSTLLTKHQKVIVCFLLRKAHTSIHKGRTEPPVLIRPWVLGIQTRVLRLEAVGNGVVAALGFCPAAVSILISMATSPTGL